MDKFSKKERSAIMRAVKSSKNRSTELKLIELFRRHKIKGWRRNQKVFGRPDFYFPKLRLAIFADGCFWHGCNCKKLRPVTNVKYWKNKIKKNVVRDHFVNSVLTKKGYLVVRIKECRIKNGVLPQKLLEFFNNPSV